MFSSLLLSVVYAEQGILTCNHLKENVFNLNDYSTHASKIAITISDIIKGLLFNS